MKNKNNIEENFELKDKPKEKKVKNEINGSIEKEEFLKFLYSLNEEYKTKQKFYEKYNSKWIKRNEWFLQKQSEYFKFFKDENSFSIFLLNKIKVDKDSMYYYLLLSEFLKLKKYSIKITQILEIKKNAKKENINLKNSNLKVMNSSDFKKPNFDDLDIIFKNNNNKIIEKPISQDEFFTLFFKHISDFVSIYSEILLKEIVKIKIKCSKNKYLLLDFSNKELIVEFSSDLELWKNENELPLNKSKAAKKNLINSKIALINRNIELLNYGWNEEKIKEILEKIKENFIFIYKKDKKIIDYLNPILILNSKELEEEDSKIKFKLLSD